MYDLNNSPSFSRELENNRRLKQNYEKLPLEEKCRILARAHHIQSQEAMNLYAMSLSNETRADEFF